jgi:peptide deformylase
MRDSVSAEACFQKRTHARSKLRTTMPEPLELSLTLYPDPILRKVADPVTAFDAELVRTVVAMFERMVASKGVGLAAPQVGLKKRILVLNATGDAKDNLALINPTIVARAGAETFFDEGCLSFPGIYAEVKRPDRCTVQAFDTSGASIEKEYSGFESRIIQHEFDHLEGVLLVDRMSPAAKLMHKAALQDLVARYKKRQATLARQP